LDVTPGSVLLVIQQPANSNGLFLVENPTAAADQAFQGAKKNINVISLAVDFVF
jgi:hypothetical protein